MKNSEKLKILLASSNPGKIQEIIALSKKLPIEWIPQSEFNIEDTEETGKSFIENAILKARHAAKISGMPALADDSGLVVDALDGAPGIFSARYAGKTATTEERNQKLLTELKDIEEADRTAAYHCVLALVETENDPVPLICHGVWEGSILFEPAGENGFGYDPIFYVPTHQCSAAELSTAEKNRISHRGQVMQQLIDVFKSANEP
ncbi:MAG: non-canonical purine NTP pyrophosphatase, RdgB/HAM1 family [Gammaproteobacteria bacterium CG_4_10_14_0_8_um_filter_38_16]|nr:MAG: non-canonical purine NTP pyrophosphatase, RdgB/HAM1 family [Gammaproteobacteria bacterium CG_4_10_14_0_8_um_filter_38_16]PJA03925.1 MAG: non-canonical purine NTP pyrophosphatase, RdgB/HAM1 family [Gammaproteobacteria bacterium CG_4_10_14_0_2_um_filter_38_22]PJB09748.1 MAG: non-canonical purine NTP pyrophosphatase, RdgB/HAM1 family [Gammaproteobacteria bacterium CG_4_9_14_3_um_filter_38_9]